MKDLKVFVIHVRGQQERERHIKKELAKFNIDFEFILDGNKEDINENILNSYFSGDMYGKQAVTSCALKHIIAYEKALENGINNILVFEDDIVLKANFQDVLEKILVEIRSSSLNNYIISLENTNHNYVQKSELVANQYLYKKEKGRCAGAYLIDLKAAKNLLGEIKHNKCSHPIDWMHNVIAKDKNIGIFWSHPHIAEQASHNGKLGSLIDHKKVGIVRRIIYFLQGEIKKRWAPKQA